MLRIDYNELEFDSNDVCRYKGSLFSGISVEASKDGRVVAETTYVGGWQDGLAKIWNIWGELRSEGTFYGGVAHGVLREWHTNGRLSMEGLFELGCAHSMTEWDEDGNIKRIFTVERGDPLYELLLIKRESFRRPRQ
jgi:antitoxin component YwqK of YwqJK toxin-antitoxin module